MATDMNKLDARQELLIITMEECGELIQACSKLLRRNELFGNSTEIDNLKTAPPSSHLPVWSRVQSQTRRTRRQRGALAASDFDIEEARDK